MITKTAAAPSAAERARTVLARAASADLEWLDDRPAEPGWTSPERIQLVTTPPCDAVPARRLRLQVADAAALPVRDRVLTRVTVSGLGWVAEPGLLALHPARVQVEEGGVVAPVAVRRFLAAEPDPVGAGEAGLLSHLHHGHPEFVTTLTRLVAADLLQSVTRVWPVRLDRYGLVLRLEYARRHRDVRLAFAAPANDLAEVREQVRALTERAARQRPGCRLGRGTA